MKIIFFGTPDYVIPILEKLHQTYNRGKERQFIAVVTRPPGKVGREQKFTRSEVDNWAYKHKLQIIFDLAEIPQADLGIVAAYGNIIPKFVISNFKFGILNIHPSLLPKYRGASPIQSALIEGETQTGLSVIKMDEKMDHGPILSQFKEEVLPTDTNESLRNRLFQRSAQFLVELIPHYLNGKIKPKEQDHDKATFTKILTKDDGFIENILESPQKTYNMYKALHPWPGIWTIVNLEGKGKKIPTRIKILEMNPNSLTPEVVQMEGKNPVTWEQFVHKDKIGV